MTGYYNPGCFHLQAGIDPCHHGSTWVHAPESPSMSYSSNDPPIYNVPVVLPPADTPDKQTIDPQKPDLTYTPDGTNRKAHRQVVGVHNARGIAYGEATALYSKHHKYSEQCYPWHPFQSAHHFQQDQWFTQQTHTWIDWHLRHGVDNFKIESFVSADALWKLLFEQDFGIGRNNSIVDNPQIFRTLYLQRQTPICSLEGRYITRYRCKHRCQYCRVVYGKLR